MTRPTIFQSITMIATLVLTGVATTHASGRVTDDLLEMARKPGPWKVETIREKDGIRNGPDYRGGTIHYPIRTEASGPATAPFPIMAICPGFQASEGSVRPWGGYLASHGIVTMTLGTNTPRDFPNLRGKALLDAIETVRAENEREGSPLRGKLAVDRTGVAGWSMGGGGAQHAAVMDPSLKGVVAMVPWQPSFRFVHDVPVMIMAGAQDEIASTRSNARPHFTNTPASTPKLLFEIRDGGHLLPSDPGNHRGEVGAWTLAWIKTFVAGDERYLTVLERRPGTASIYELSLPETADTSNESDESDTPERD